MNSFNLFKQVCSEQTQMFLDAFKHVNVTRQRGLDFRNKHYTCVRADKRSLYTKCVGSTLNILLSVIRPAQNTHFQVNPVNVTLLQMYKPLHTLCTVLNIYKITDYFPSLDSQDIFCKVQNVNTSSLFHFALISFTVFSLLFLFRKDMAWYWWELHCMWLLPHIHRACIQVSVWKQLRN